MNQQIGIQQVRKERVLDKARLISQVQRVRRSQANRNIWLVGSSNPKTPKTFYCVSWDSELESFVCDCKAFQFSADNTCKHICACAIHEEGGLGNDFLQKV